MCGSLSVPEKLMERLPTYWLSFIFVTGLISIFTWPINFGMVYNVFVNAEYLQLITNWRAVFSSPIINIEFFLGGEFLFIATKILFFGFIIGLAYKLFERQIWWINHIPKRILNKICKKEPRNGKEYPYENLNLSEENTLIRWINEDWRKSIQLEYLTFHILLGLLYSFETNVILWLFHNWVNSVFFVAGGLTIRFLCLRSKKRIKEWVDFVRFGFCLDQKICPYCRTDLTETDLKQRICPNPKCKKSLDWRELKAG